MPARSMTSSRSHRAVPGPAPDKQRDGLMKVTPMNAKKRGPDGDLRERMTEESTLGGVRKSRDDQRIG